MTSRTTPGFWACFRKMPPPARPAAVKQFQLWLRNPRHPSLHFKRINREIWSARVTQGYRALARETPDGYTWYWVGTHDDYDQRLA